MKREVIAAKKWRERHQKKEGPPQAFGAFWLCPSCGFKIPDDPQAIEFNCPSCKAYLGEPVSDEEWDQIIHKSA